MASKSKIAICKFCRHAFDTDDPDGDMAEHLKTCPAYTLEVSRLREENARLRAELERYRQATAPTTKIEVPPQKKEEEPRPRDLEGPPDPDDEEQA